MTGRARPDARGGARRRRPSASAAPRRSARPATATSTRTPTEEAGGTGERLQKLLARAGIASRRSSETLITQGRVTVNGAVVTALGSKADPSVDDIRVDGRRLPAREPLRYILLDKPTGYVTTRRDPQRRRTVLELVGSVSEYVYPVGRLDYDTEGLLLLTNDGDLAAALTHPRHDVPRTYEAVVQGVPDDKALGTLRRGVPLDGVRTRPAVVDVVGERGRRDSCLLRITIREGRNRQVRRMCEAVGHPVRHLRRTQFGPLSDRGLKAGEWRHLTAAEVAALNRSVATPVKSARRPGPSASRPAGRRQAR